MAQHVTMRLTDDLDGSEDDVQTVPFTHKRVQYFIDLGRQNRDEFDVLMARYVRAARRHRRNPGPYSRPRSREDSRKIRQWLMDNHYISPAAKLGRLKEQHIQLYEDTHSETGGQK